jgi:hypothetical protein
MNAAFDTMPATMNHPQQPTSSRHRHYKRSAGVGLPGVLLACILVVSAPACAQHTDPLFIPENIATQADGRLPIGELLARYQPLLDAGWQLEAIAFSQPAGTDAALPILALRTPVPGPAAWFIAGIHGEEPAGPNALALSVDTLRTLGERLPVVVVPLANPWGYARNWRYLNLPAWSAEQEAQSVGDAAHWLPDPAEPGVARANAASSPEAAALTEWVLALANTYPPRWSIDLHEDNLIHAGYVYSQGLEGADDPLAARAVAVLREHGITVQMEGETRFEEAIVDGIVGPVEDSSIDELLSAREVIGPGGLQPGPAAHTVLVFETPAAALSLEQRVVAHRALIEALSVEMQP